MDESPVEKQIDERSYGDDAMVVDSEGQLEEYQIFRLSSHLRRPGMTFNITEEDYVNNFWPKLAKAIDLLLAMIPGKYVPISYEQMYSCVYKCVCKQMSEQLYNDLLSHIENHLEKMSQTLLSYQPMICQYIEKCHQALSQYLRALSAIVPIFNYLNRLYVEAKLQTELSKELKKLFVKCVANRHLPKLIPFMVEANSTAFLVQPSVVAELAVNIHSLDPELVNHHPQLFSKYVTNILPACQEDLLSCYALEAQQMSRDLHMHPEFVLGEQRAKRPPDESDSQFRKQLAL